MKSISFYVLFLTLALLSGCVTIPVADMNVKATILTAGGDGPRYKRVPQEIFTQADQINYLTTITWDDVESSAGRHKVVWKWYNNNKLVTVIERKYNFYTTPFELLGYISGLSIGNGRNKVELYIDDKLLTSKVFSVE
jgi:hypothetical protein